MRRGARLDRLPEQYFAVLLARVKVAAAAEGSPSSPSGGRRLPREQRTR